MAVSDGPYDDYAAPAQPIAELLREHNTFEADLAQARLLVKTLAKALEERKTKIAAYMVEHKLQVINMQNHGKMRLREAVKTTKPRMSEVLEEVLDEPTRKRLADEILKRTTTTPVIKVSHLKARQSSAEL
jgi:altronate dehydratase